MASLAPFPSSAEPVSAVPSEAAHKKALLRNYRQHKEALLRRQRALKKESGPEVATLGGAEGSHPLAPIRKSSQRDLSPAFRRSNRDPNARVSFASSESNSPPERKPGSPQARRLRKLPTSVRHMRKMDSIDDVFEGLSINAHMPADRLIEGLQLAHCKVPKGARSQNICKPSSELGISRTQFRSLVDALGRGDSSSDDE